MHQTDRRDVNTMPLVFDCELSLSLDSNLHSPPDIRNPPILHPPSSIHFGIPFGIPFGRVPWPGGARRVDLAWLLAAALLWLVRTMPTSVVYSARLLLVGICFRRTMRACERCVLQSTSPGGVISSLFTLYSPFSAEWSQRSAQSNRKSPK